jgi:preprotein translocase subunit SecD
MPQTLQRFKEWVATLDVRPIAKSATRSTVQDGRREVTSKQKEIGYRTFLLKSKAEITGDLVRDAGAARDQSSGSARELARSS